VSDLKPAAQYKFKVFHVDENDDAVGKPSNATGYIMSSDASPAEKFKMKLQRIEEQVSDAIDEFKNEEDRLRVTSHNPLPTTTVEETMEECINRFDSAGARQDALIDQREARAAIGKFGKKLEEAVTKLNDVVTQHHKTSAEQACWLPQDLEQALNAFKNIVEHLESQVKVPRTAANRAPMEDKEAQLEEFRELGVKLANAIDGSFKDITHQVDSDQASKMYNKIRTLKALVPKEDKILAAAVQKLESGVYARTTYIKYIPSLNKTNSMR